ncbi:MAG: hypothetical protein J5506_03755 [Prevotella sp.]|nr:hypothetical protein [Prevotella sp.]
MGKFCLYADNQKDAPCAYIKMYKYSYLANFLKDEKHSKGIQNHSIPLLIRCIKKEEDSVSKFSVKDEYCINCMFCIFGCVGNRILLSDRFHPKTFCYDITKEELAELERMASKLFKGTFIHLPKVLTSQLSVKYKSFESFTAVDETKNIAVWTANAMKFLSTSFEPRLSLEVGLKIYQRDRGGRLDVTLLNTRDKYLFVAETKVDFNHMMAEGRYESQMIAYETELEQVDDSIKRAKFLVIGGRECDMLPPTIQGSTSGPRADLFYDVLLQQDLFFISANALLSLGLQKLYISINKYSLEALFPIINSKKFVGLLSSGVVTAEKEIIALDDAYKFVSTL